MLITEMGIEEFRAILHYQMMQFQLLNIAVDKNQLLLDGNMKAMHEVEFMSSKDGLEFVLPNSNLDVSRALSRNLSSANFKNNFKKEAAEHFFSLISFKTKLRQASAKKYQIFMNKLTTSNHKIEGKLRILRSYRIKLTHIYCRDVLKEAYQESLCTQLLKI